MDRMPDFCTLACTSNAEAGTAGGDWMVGIMAAIGESTPGDGMIIVTGLSLACFPATSSVIAPSAGTAVEVARITTGSSAGAGGVASIVVVVDMVSAAMGSAAAGSAMFWVEVELKRRQHCFMLLTDELKSCL